MVQELGIGLRSAAVAIRSAGAVTAAPVAAAALRVAAPAGGAGGGAATARAVARSGAAVVAPMPPAPEFEDVVKLGFGCGLSSLEHAAKAAADGRRRAR